MAEQYLTPSLSNKFRRGIIKDYKRHSMLVIAFWKLGVQHWMQWKLR
jgi:hypothetical protein